MNIFRKTFTALELYEWFQKTFPDSFSVSIYEDVENTVDNVIRADWDKCVFSTYLWFTANIYDKRRYYLYDRQIFVVHSGDENSYIRFYIEDENSDFFVVSWGYKRCDVEEDYLHKFLTIYLNTIHNREICKDDPKTVS